MQEKIEKNRKEKENTNGEKRLGKGERKNECYRGIRNMLTIINGEQEMQEKVEQRNREK